MIVSLNVYAYLKFWKTPSMVFWSVMVEEELSVLSSSAGAKGFLHPYRRVKRIAMRSSFVLIYPPLQFAPAGEVAVLGILPIINTPN